MAVSMTSQVTVQTVSLRVLKVKPVEKDGGPVW
jgi:hypothetical protein